MGVRPKNAIFQGILYSRMYFLLIQYIKNTVIESNDLCSKSYYTNPLFVLSFIKYFKKCVLQYDYQINVYVFSKHEKFFCNLLTSMSALRQDSSIRHRQIIIFSYEFQFKIHPLIWPFEAKQNILNTSNTLQKLSLFQYRCYRYT